MYASRRIVMETMAQLLLFYYCMTSFQGGECMSLVINNNLMANTVNRNLSSHYKSLESSIEKLASGMRVNSAADDAAGLAISELMRADIAATDQGVRNANDAISLIQTADGAMQVIDDSLIRMKELAEQAATGTYDSTQRAIIDSEYQAMASEITRIANSAEFNGVKLLDGSLSGDYAGTYAGDPKNRPAEDLVVHFGTGNDSSTDYYKIKIGSISADSLGLGSAAGDADGATISTQAGAQKALEALDKAITSKDKFRADLGAIQNRLEATIENLTVQSENLSAAESRIRDVDVAVEMTQFVKNQILTQSAVSMLAQANQIPSLAAQLVG